MHPQLDPIADSSDQAAPRLIRLLDAEPDFAAGVPEHDVAAARRHTIATALALPPGEWAPAQLRSDDPVTGPFAALVVTGLIARDVVLADRATTQLVGPGDVISLRDWDDGSPPVSAVWRVAALSEVAVLDSRFLGATQRWPWLTARLVERTARWADRAATLQAITQLGRVDLRLVALLWHLADRWGRVRPEGVVLPLRLTHESLGRLVGAQRPTVTLALRELRQQGAVRRRGVGWLLTPESRGLLEPAIQPAALAPVAPIQPEDMDEKLRAARDVVRDMRGRDGRRRSGEGGIRTLERG